MTDQKNLIIAIVLSIGIILAFQFFYELPRVRQAQEVQQQQQQAATKPAPTQPVASQPARPPPVPRPGRPRRRPRRRPRPPHPACRSTTAGCTARYPWRVLASTM